MLFNSYIFLFAFLPFSLLVFWGLQRAGKPEWAMTALVPLSFLFYAWWNPPYLLLLIVSLLANHWLGNRIADSEKQRHRLFWLGVAGNLTVLGWFKYAGFACHALNGTGLASCHLQSIFLPLGISFFTFEQITYLHDLAWRKIKKYSLRDYAVFVSFFPHLIAGPIVYAGELLPQIEKFAGRPLFWRNMATGFGLLTIGLVKKLLIADHFAGLADPIFTAAAHKTPSFGDGWAGALAYTFQLYFDFSGYSDMALGLGLMFGLRLPVNFLSPYKATSIIDFWRRWHITMSRFFRDYIYIPLGGNRVRPPRQMVNLALTMFCAGLWHGAGWTFIAWGLLHGAYLIINTAWRALWQKIRPDQKPIFATRALAHILTMLAVVTAWVIFRADTFATAGHILSAMAGQNALHGLPLKRLMIFAPAYLLCLLAPASVEYFGFTDREHAPAARRWHFAPTRLQAAGLAIFMTASILSLQHITKFLYFQF